LRVFVPILLPKFPKTEILQRIKVTDWRGWPDDSSARQHLMSKRAGATVVESKGSRAVYVSKPHALRPASFPRLRLF
jgi:hypothetical protein